MGQGKMEPTQIKAISSLVEIREDTTRKIGARGLTSVSTDRMKTGRQVVPCLKGSSKRCILNKLSDSCTALLPQFSIRRSPLYIQSQSRSASVICEGVMAEGRVWPTRTWDSEKLQMKLLFLMRFNCMLR